MPYYLRLKRFVKNHISFDKWVSLNGGKFLVHYNLYEKCIEVKDEHFELLDSFDIEPLMFFSKKSMIEAVKEACKAA